MTEDSEGAHAEEVVVVIGVEKDLEGMRRGKGYLQGDLEMKCK